MRKYFIISGGYANTYQLRYTEGTTEVPEHWERITRNKAIQLCRAERDRRIYGGSFSGYADSNIYPADWQPTLEWLDDHATVTDGYIVKRI